MTVNAGDNPHVTLRLTVDPKTGADGAVTTRDDHSTRRTIGYVVAGVGAAALIGSGVTFLVRQGAKSDVEDACPTLKGCSNDLQDTVDRGKTMSTLTSILLPVGVVGVAAGLVLVFTSGSSKNDASKTATARSIRIAPTLGGLDITGRF